MSDLVNRLHERAESYRQGGPSSEHTAVMLEEAASRLSQQDAELERLQALYDREMAAHRISVDEAIAEARKAAFIEAAEIADGHSSMRGTTIAGKIRAKAEETGR